MAQQQRSHGDRVLNAGISLALDKLVGQGEFYPFGVALTGRGQIQVLMHQESRYRPSGEEFIESLRGALSTGAKQGEFVAAAIVADFAFEKPTEQGELDAIRVAVEVANGDPVTCFLPYTLMTPAGTRDVRPGELFAQRGEKTIFQ
ncbi:MAG: hypothetical protein JO101_10405 [Candidatus Eremiobacteraeota bacterium]|nr:hypothetical protein [Candidatus Eremiobacteraeota bacterium]MBV8355720.1 hypothetical protein [Candidatus Eremiobacteraeota bacterium]